MFIFRVSPLIFEELRMKTKETELKEAREIYFKAKVYYQYVRAEADKLDGPYCELYDNGKLTDEEIVKKFTEHDKKFKVSEAHDILRMAEDKVLEAGKRIFKTLYPEEFNEAKEVFDSGLITVRRKVLDLILSLRV